MLFTPTAGIPTYSQFRLALSRRPAIIASIRDAGAYMTPMKIRALKFTCRLADCVLANSAAGRTWLIEQGVSEKKIDVIRNGIHVPAQAGRGRDAGAFRKGLGIPAGTAVCAYVGRVVSRKGIDDYLRAARILTDPRTRCSLPDDWRVVRRNKITRLKWNC
jgi:glycosyltransferase involved in cell wall biosynthesis